MSTEPDPNLLKPQILSGEAVSRESGVKDLNHSPTPSTEAIPADAPVLSQHVDSVVQIGANHPFQATSRNPAGLLWTSFFARLARHVGMCPRVWIWLAAVWPWFSHQGRQ